MVSYIGRDDDSYLGIETETYFCNGNKGDYYIRKEWQTVNNTPICCTVMVNVAEDTGADDFSINNASEHISLFAEMCKENNSIADMELCSEVDMYNDSDCVEVTIYTDESDIDDVFNTFCDYFGEE